MPDQALIPVPDTEDIASAADTWQTTAQDLVVQDQENFEIAGRFLQDIQALRRQVKETFEKPKKLAHAAHKAILDAEKIHDAPLASAEIIIKTKASTYADEERKRRQREELQRQAAARQAEEDERLHQAELLEQAGETEEAERVLEEEPPPPPPPTRASVTPKATGISVRTTWKAEVVSLRKLCEAIVEGRVPESAVMPNTTVINGCARSMQKDFNWPGCRLQEQTGIAGQRR